MECRICKTSHCCLDNMMGNACLETNLSIADIINYCKDRYFSYNSSPDIAIDDT